MNGLFGGGSGTMFSPYLVEDAQDLDAVRNNLTAYYLQTADIDLSSFANWNPIRNFKGVFSGSKYKIYNLTINRGTETDVGLFGSVDNAEIVALRGIKLVNANVIGGENTGAVVGSGKCYIKKCSVTDSYVKCTASRGRCGGLAGMIIESKISYCSVNNITIDSVGLMTGGMVGSGSSLREAKFCFAENVNVNNSYEGTGGLFGKIEPNVKSCVVRYCKSTGTVNGKNLTGGLIGELYSYSSEGSLMIDWNYSECSVSGRDYVGGLIGATNLYSTSPNFRGIMNSYSTGKIQGIKYLAGILGYSKNNEMNVQKCYSSGDIVSTDSGDYRTMVMAGIATGDGINAHYNIVLGNTTSNVGTNSTYRVGRIVSDHPSPTMIATNNSYLDSISVVGLTNPDGEPITISDAKTKATYEAKGWSFNNRREWQIQEGVSFPYLNLDIGWIGVSEILEKVNGNWETTTEIWQKRNGVWEEITEVWEINK